jgi:quercetin dioxygenase-like cupin family protein
MHKIPERAGPPVEEPIVNTVLIAGNVFIKTYTLPAANTLIGQHSHTYAHASQIASGSARFWKNGQWLADVVAPHSVEIEAHAEHVIQSLEPNTVVNCIHCVETAAASIEEAEESLIEGH